MLEKTTHLAREFYALIMALGHRDTPLLAKIWLLFTLGYILSPIDLIPDFIPVIGYVDDVLLIPLAVWVAVRLIPPSVLEECRVKADEANPSRFLGWAGASMVVLIWLGALLMAFYGVKVVIASAQS